MGSSKGKVRETKMVRKERGRQGKGRERGREEE